MRKVPNEAKVVNLCAEIQSIKQQGYIAGFINGLSTLLSTDTGADISQMSKEIYDQLGDKPEFCNVNVDLFSATTLAKSPWDTFKNYEKL